MEVSSNQRRIVLGAIGAGLVAPWAVRAQTGAKPKIAIVMPGNITDKSWNQAGYEGIKLIEKELGLTVAFSEKVAQPDQAEALADYARRGFNLVFGHGGEFQESAARIAKRFPNTQFVVNNGYVNGPNLASITFDYRQFGAVLGHIAARTTKTGKAGMIGAQRIRMTTEIEAGYKEAFAKVHPKGQVLVTYTNDWDDVAKGKEAAFAQIAQGADVIFPTMDNAVIGSLQAAREKKVSAFGIYYDAIKDWPDTVIQSAIVDIRAGMLDIARDYAGGTLKSTVHVFGIGRPDPRVARLGTYGPNVSADVRKQVDELVAAWPKA
jgi:basic membrane protein A and related proteins